MGVLMRPTRRATEVAGPAVSGDAPAVIPLERAGQAGTAVVGAKAANLGRAGAGGLPVLDGFVLSTDAVAAIAARRGDVPDGVREELALHWAQLSANGAVPLVVRSSSPVEDQSASSMAGHFASVVDVSGWSSFRDAVDAVIRSARRPGAGGRPSVTSPMAVLVQPYLDPELSGVLFGLDPLSGRTDRRVVAAVEGGPWRLVSGEVDGTRYLLTPRGRLLEMEGEPLALRRRDHHRLARLAGAAGDLFGGPQDVEWALDGDGVLWLLQARPVTAAAPPASGPVLGPGPVAETFPDALGPLEEDLWVPPLRQAMAESLRLTAAASHRRLASSPVLVTVAGRVAADLRLMGALPGRPSLWSRLDPRPSFRRLGAAWTVGRLRAALPELAADIVAAVDAELRAVPALDTLADDDLLLLVERARACLVPVHGYEMLAGLLPGAEVSAASLALEAVAAGRAEGLTDAEAVAARPVALTLTPPAISRLSRLPDGVPGGSDDARGVESLGPREALRLRARWLHELTARSCLELGSRLAGRGLLEGPADVGLLSWTELTAAVTDGEPAPADDGRRLRLSPPLPPAFRLTAAGHVVAVAARTGLRDHPGQGASPGRGIGPVYAGPLPAPAGSVLVVSTLDPHLAAHLPGLAGLVAETGSVLSHLAILAREFGVPCVVGCTGALDRFPAGTSVVVDGTTGEVTTGAETGR